MNISSYPKVYQMGHRTISDILLDPVIVEEKVDGSQFSFGVFGGELRCRSRGAELDLDHPQSLFLGACETARRLAPVLRDGWTYRGETLQSKKHNSLVYSRIPSGHVILFDVMTDKPEWYLERTEKEAEAERIGLEVVPMLFSGVVEKPSDLLEFLNLESVLGGQKIEGVVVKNHKRFALDGKPLIGKYVSEAFKEVHRGDWKERNPNRADVVEGLVEKYRTPARWQKAVQHLAESGTLDGSPKDIGPLLKEVSQDVEAECAEAIKEALWAHFRKQILRGVTMGLPEWYKRKLLDGGDVHD